MHVGSLMLFTPPPGEASSFAQGFAERARIANNAVPPFSERLVRKLGASFWEEDKEFDIESHFFHLALPRPGRIRELLALVSQLHGATLDRAKPLWEAYLIEGVEGGAPPGSAGWGGGERSESPPIAGRVALYV